MSNLDVVDRSSDIRLWVLEARRLQQTVALVPTMGNLHDGHLSLARLARRVADRVVMSIFVNPTQFGPSEDFAGYPRTLDDDRAAVAAAGTVDALFVPGEREIYPFGVDAAVRIGMPPLARELCGASRPGHFDGVAAVVCRLLNIVTPEALVLGRKDYQQLVLIERLVSDLGIGTRVTSGPTRRHDDGLAMSSRNRYLTARERLQAPALHAVLDGVRAAVHGGERDYARLEADACDRLRAAGLEPEYVELRAARDLATRLPASPGPGELIVLAAARLGLARLIDNLII